MSETSLHFHNDPSTVVEGTDYTDPSKYAVQNQWPNSPINYNTNFATFELADGAADPEIFSAQFYGIYINDGNYGDSRTAMIALTFNQNEFTTENPIRVSSNRSSDKLTLNIAISGGTALDAGIAPPTILIPFELDDSAMDAQCTWDLTLAVTYAQSAGNSKTGTYKFTKISTPPTEDPPVFP